MTENTTSESKKDKAVCPVAVTYTVTKDAATDNITGTATYKMTQKTDGTVSKTDVTIGGVTLTSDKFTTGTATITIKDDGTASKIEITK